MAEPILFSELTRRAVLDMAADGERMDGRSVDEFRKAKIQTGVIKNAEGSALVELGSTKVLAGIKLGLGKPFDDRPDEGALSTGAELSPLASSDFEAGPPSAEAVEVARVTDRVIRESETLDLKKLCITPGEKVWSVFMDVYTLDMDGNLFDASALACMAGLLTVRMPKLEGEGEKLKVIYDEHAGPLPLACRPVAVTHAKLGNKIVADPTDLEGKIMGARLTIGLKDESTICAMQKGGVGYFTDSEVEAIIERSFAKAKMLRELLPKLE